MYPYPTNVREEIGILLSALTNPHAIIPKDVVHAALNVLCYGASIVYGDGAAPLTIVAADVDSEGDRALLVAALRQLQTCQAGGEGAIPWGLILPLVFQLLQRWLVG